MKNEIVSPVLGRRGEGQNVGCDSQRPLLTVLPKSALLLLIKGTYSSEQQREAQLDGIVGYHRKPQAPFTTLIDCFDVFDEFIVRAVAENEGKVFGHHVMNIAYNKMESLYGVKIHFCVGKKRIWSLILRKIITRKSDVKNAGGKLSLHPKYRAQILEMLT